MDSGGPASGWTLLSAVMSLQGGNNVAFVIFAIHLMGVSSIMGAINIIATILNMRAPQMNAAAHAPIRVDLVDHRLFADRGHARIGGGSDDAADR